MHIISGQFQAASRHQFERTESQVSIRRELAPAPAPESAPPRRLPPPVVDLVTPGSAQANAHSVLRQSQPAPTSTEAAEPGTDPEWNLFKALVEALTGKQIETASIGQSAAAPTVSATPPPSATAPSSAAAAADNSRVLRIDAMQISEQEITEVAFSGQFQTADGRSISLDLSYSMQRSYSATGISASVSSGAAKDPLVLNFDGLGARLRADRYDFDLDSDGADDSVATLASGSAYLALDRNGDGQINNGSELFGTLSGDGFADLTAYDVDGNGFIDEADPVFSQLSLFRPNDTLRTLASRDVGAILGNIDSPARLTDANNQSLGQLRATGFYLSNSGGAGLVQQVDLVT